MTAYVVITAREGQTCVWCDRAKALLTAKGIAFTAVPMTDGLKPFFDAVFDDPQCRTVPQVFYAGRLIGGFAALEKAFSFSTRTGNNPGPRPNIPGHPQ